MKILLPLGVQEALWRLQEAGYEAYAVGGCVRDTVLHRTPQDWDITTNATPDETEKVFSGEKILDIGRSHGTLTVFLNGQPLEITTYRTDGEYTDHRHPDSVRFTRSLQEDLARRDFTVNAMAYSPSTGIVDAFSGLADLENCNIRCVGDPETRFTEDALRILRALRFASVLGFSVDGMTARAIHKLHPLLHRISAERISAELLKLLCGQNVNAILTEFPDVICTVLPELAPCVGMAQENPYHHLTVYEHTVETVAAVPADPVLRLTMLLHDCGKPRCYTRDANGIDHFRGHPPISAILAEQAMERLRIDNATQAEVKEYILHHDDTLSPTDRSLKRLLARFGDERVFDYIAVRRADILGQHPDKRDRLNELDAICERLKELINEHACYSLKDLRVNGTDLLNMGFPADQRLGNALQTLLDDVIDGKCPNERASLLRRAQKLL